MMTHNISFIKQKFSIEPYIDLQSPNQILTTRKRYVRQWEKSCLNHLAQVSDVKLHVAIYNEEDLQPYIRLLDSISRLTVWLPETSPMIPIVSDKMFLVRYTQLRLHENFIFLNSNDYSIGIVYWHNVTNLIPEKPNNKAFLGVLLSNQKAIRDIVKILDLVSLNRNI